MKALLTSFLLTPLLALSATAASTIHPENRYAYGFNIGWMDWRTDGASGAAIGLNVCSGYIYASNVGWIHLGNGAPANGISYQNDTTSDFGVNHDGCGNLRGYAYAANIGWVRFEEKGAPRLDLATGKLSGFIYGANAGWISLSNAQAYVQTDVILPGPDSDRDGIPDAWELERAGDLISMNAASDSDADAVSDYKEYLADTDPFDANDYLRVTAFDFDLVTEMVSITWLSRPTRLYRVEYRSALDPANPWTKSALDLIRPDAGATTTRAFLDPDTDLRFFRIEALCPVEDLTPPPAPTRLRVFQGPTDNQVGLQWDSIIDAGLKEYILYRDDLEIQRTPATSVLHSYLLPDHTYSFKVAAVDNAGNRSAFSAPLVVNSLPRVLNEGVRRVKVLLCHFSDYPDVPFTAAEANTQLLDNPWDLKAYFAEVSYGRLTLEGDTSGWFALPRPGADYGGSFRNGQWFGSNRARILADLRALLPGEIDLESYDIVAVIVNGMGEVGENAGNFNYFGASHGLDMGKFAHEFGHAFNATLHAGSWDGCDDDQPVGPDLLNLRDGGCQVSRYGDYYDPMGASSSFHFSMFHKEKMGFLHPENIATIEADGDYTLYQMELPRADVQMLKIPLPYEMFYFLEYRTEQGFNGPDTPDPFSRPFDGVLLRLRLSKFPGTDADTLIPRYPSLVLNPGTPFIDPYRGLQVEVLEKLGDHVRLRVTGLPLEH
jgi:fibronectin type III domain protein